MSTLTTVYGVNNTKTNITLPTVKVPASEAGGRVRHLYDEYTPGTGDEFGTSGLIKMMTIPKGARVIDAQVVCPATGATGIFDIGWAASAESGAVTADADGFFVGIDPGAAAVDANMAGTVAGWNKTFDEAVVVQVDCTEATASMATLTLKLSILYVLD